MVLTLQAPTHLQLRSLSQSSRAATTRATISVTAAPDRARSFETKKGACIVTPERRPH